ncbi:RecX family transcriptional regulator [Segetibacter sp. 3557_3]|uniref:regulatory protein RecX n=1 Tax=Segetibacter sp. 3557_3 TaxID=2547429 RepID=UPI00105912D2|nr:RecX family transcriptional regulator [Segetibacter sp. 3557_3]TDH25224.1 RecX family transcriptional regulator [Segetibacter sp. 3557_3]
MFNNKSITPEAALQKAKSFCAYQERSHREVRDKLYAFGLRKTDVEQVLTALIEENYLNEERFATQFAGGKFRVKGWGKIKIRYELRQKGVSAYCISHALAAIDSEDYTATLHKYVRAKAAQLTNEPVISRNRKIQAYLLQKGYEPLLIAEAIKGLGSGEAGDHVGC